VHSIAGDGLSRWPFRKPHCLPRILQLIPRLDFRGPTCGEGPEKSGAGDASVCSAAQGPIPYVGQLPLEKGASTETLCPGIWPELSIRLMGKGSSLIGQGSLRFLLCGLPEICIWLSSSTPAELNQL
jgi:hypothetical protein